MSEFCCKAFQLQLENNYISIVMDENGRHFVVWLNSTFGSDSELELHYCPFCGVKLGD